MDKYLNNYICIITGSTGFLGREVTAFFIERGATVVTNYRNEQRFLDLKSGVSQPENLIGLPADLTEAKSVAGFFRKFSESYRRLDVFIHLMGGFWMGGEIGETPPDKWDQMINLNLGSTFLCTRQAFAIFKKQCSGKIFTVSAKSAVDLPTGTGAYAVSKAGVLALSEILAKEGKPYNIQVNSLLPSTIDTPANRKAMPDADFSTWVTPKDIAQLLANLSRPENRALSQTALKVYGKL